MRTFLILLGVVAILNAATPSFDVASIKPNHDVGKGGERGGENIAHSPTGITMTNVTLATCIEWAYQVREFQIAGAPAWAPSEGFDIVAKTGGEVSEETLRLMMQTLLAQRFGLRTRSEKKDLPVYALTVAKGGHKLHRSENADAAAMKPAGGDLVFTGITMSDFADRLARRPLKVDRPVVDETGLDGAWDFRLSLATNISDLKMTLEGMDRGDSSAPLLSSLIQSQLGLRLESRRDPVDVLVIEHASRVPTGN